MAHAVAWFAACEIRGKNQWGGPGGIQPSDETAGGASCYECLNGTLKREILRRCLSHNVDVSRTVRSQGDAKRSVGTSTAQIGAVNKGTAIGTEFEYKCVSSSAV